MKGRCATLLLVFLPQATFRVLKGVGHLSPLQARDAIAHACLAMLEGLRSHRPEG